MLLLMSLEILFSALQEFSYKTLTRAGNRNLLYR